MKQKETIRSLWTPTAGMLTGARRAAMLLLTTLLLTMTAQTALAEEEGHNIIYELYGGTNSPDNPETYNSEAGVSSLSNPTPPEKSGYTFGGWYRDPEFLTLVSDTAIPSGSTGDFKFYAKWLKSITVPVIWDDNNNLDGKRPTSVEVYLLANEEPIGGAITVSSEGNWTYTFENMPVHHSGEEIIYTISVPDNMPLDDLYKYSIEGTDFS